MHRLTSLLAAGMLFLCANALAAPNIYLCVTDAGYAGDSNSLANCSDVVSFTSTGFVDGTLPVARDIKLAKRFDSSSLTLRRAMVNATLLNEVKIRVFSTTPPPTEYEDIRLRDAHVASASFTTDVSGDLPTDNIAFTAARIEYSYRKPKQDGTFASAIFVCWDVANQTATNSTCP